MRITPVSKTNFKIQTNNNTMPVTSTPMMQRTNVATTQNQVSFTSLGSALKDLFAGKKILNTADEVLKALIKKEYGLYAKIGEKFEYISPRKSVKMETKDSITEIILKSPSSKSKRFNGNRTTTHKYRLGLNPDFAIILLEGSFKNLTKITTIVDDGMHVLSLPSEPELRAKAIESFKKSGQAEMQREVGYVKPKHKADFNFNLTQAMIKEANIPGLSIEKLLTQRGKRIFYC